MRGLAIGLTHVLLAAIALGAIAVWGDGADPGRTASQVTLPDPDPRLPVVAALSIVSPPGHLVLDTTSHQRGAPLEKVMPEKEANALRAVGAVHVQAQISRTDGFTQGVLQIGIRDDADRAEALHTVDELYAGWQLEPSPVDGLLVRRLSAGPGQPLATYRAHYRFGPYLIRIEAYGPDNARVERDFTELARRQLAAAPPDAR